MRFDLWMMRTYPNIPFERYADKTIGHCNAQTRRGDYERTADRVAAYPGAPAAVERTRSVPHQGRKGASSSSSARRSFAANSSRLRSASITRHYRRMLHAATTLAACRQI
jgi:hypothetical protein